MKKAFRYPPIENLHAAGEGGAMTVTMDGSINRWAAFGTRIAVDLT
jgi:hypothetical protein